MTADPNIGDLLRTVATDIEASADAWSSIEVGLGRRRQRMIASVAVASVAVIALGIAAAWILRAEPRSFVGEPESGSVTYRHPDGWSWTYPRAWDAQRIRAQSRTSLDITRIASGPLAADAFAGFEEHPPKDRPAPDDGVVVEMLYSAGGPPPRPPDPPGDTAFPISLEEAQPSHADESGWLTIPIARENGVSHWLNVWIGPEAPEELARAAEEVVASMEWGQVEGGYCSERECPVQARREREAVTAALSDSNVMERIGDEKHVVLDMSAPEVPQPKAGIASGLCEVWECWDVQIYLYDSQMLVKVRVTEPDLDVVDIADVPGAHGGLTEAERQEAYQIAEADPDVIAAIAGQPYVHRHNMFELSSGKGSPCFKRRCTLEIFHFDGSEIDGMGRQLHVLVDLALGEVVEIRDESCTPKGCKTATIEPSARGRRP